MSQGFNLTLTGFWGVILIIVLFIFGVIADEIVRQILHWILDSRVAYAGRYIRLYFGGREIPVEATKSVRLDLDEGEPAVGLRPILERISREISSQFDNPELVGNSSVRAASKHEPGATLEIRASGNQTPADENQCVLAFSVTGKVPYKSLPDHVAGLFADLDRAVAPALSMPTIGKPSSGASSLVFSIRNPPKVLDLFRKFNVAEVRGIGVGVQVALTGHELVVSGEMSSDMSRVIREAVTWYY